MGVGVVKSSTVAACGRWRPLVVVGGGGGRRWEVVSDGGGRRRLLVVVGGERRLLVVVGGERAGDVTWHITSNRIWQAPVRGPSDVIIMPLILSQ